MILGSLLVLLVLITALFVVVVRRMLAGPDPADSNLDWLEEFSIENYRPMERLLTDEDLDFIKTQPGFRPEMIGKLRSERRKLFRHYLRKLTRDFNRLHAAAKLVVLYSAQDRPEFTVLLLKQKFVFAWAILAIQIRLTMHSFGMGTVNIHELIESVELMRDQIRDFAPQSAGA